MMGSPDSGYGGYGGSGSAGMMPGGGMGGGYGSGGYAASYTVSPPYDPQNFAMICNLALSCLAGVLG